VSECPVDADAWLVLARREAEGASAFADGVGRAAESFADGASDEAVVPESGEDGVLVWGPGRRVVAEGDAVAVVHASEILCCVVPASGERFVGDSRDRFVLVHDFVGGIGEPAEQAIVGPFLVGEFAGGGRGPSL
jgi:hypothetical protein